MSGSHMVDSAIDDPMNDALNDDPAAGPMGDALTALRHDPTHPLNARNPAGAAVNAPPLTDDTDDGVPARPAGRGMDRRAARAVGAQAFGAQAFGATTAAGAVAVGALSVGALAIGALAIRRLRVRDAHLHAVEIDDLSVGRLRVRELIVEDERYAGKER
jgi:hypothetical protein